MTVDTVHDLSSLDKESYYNELRRFPENAHAKRLEGAVLLNMMILLLLMGQHQPKNSPIRSG